MTHRELLEKAVDRLHHERAVLLSRIERLVQAQLDYRPSRNAWSAGQVAHHVALGESVWQGHLKNVLAGGKQEGGAVERVSLDQIPFRSRIVPDFVFKSPLVVLPLSFLVSMMPRAFQSMLFAVPLIKMEAGSRMLPTPGLPRTQILRQLEATRKATLNLIEPCAEWDLTRFRVIHPLVGDQDIYGVLDLLASHEQRHSLQIDSIRKQPGFPMPDDRAKAV